MRTFLAAPARDGGSGVGHGGTATASATPGAGREADLGDAKAAHEVGLVGGVDRICDQTVDVLGLETRVLEGGSRRLRRQLELGATGVLGELGLPDPRQRYFHSGHYIYPIR